MFSPCTTWYKFKNQRITQLITKKKGSQNRDKKHGDELLFLSSANVSALDRQISSTLPGQKWELGAVHGAELQAS